jgi:flagellar hook-basal body complex protein FliE
MSLEPIAAVGSDAIAATAETALGVEAPAAGAFDGILASVEHLNGQLLEDQAAVVSMALNPNDNLHHTVIGMERTRLSFELMLALRNKVLDAYQELMRMQV